MSVDAEQLSALAARLRAAGCVFAEDEARLLLDEFDEADLLEERVRRREAGEPLELVLGWAELGGVRLEVAAGVFVPRRRTELVVRLAKQLVTSPEAIVVDLCCGVGAVLAALWAHGARPAEAFAVDVDPVAVACASRNLSGTGALVALGDLDAPLPGRLAGRVDLITANVFYVPSGELALMPREARDFEPVHALDGGADGVELHRRIAQLAPRWLAPGGHLLIESSERQAELTATAMSLAGLETSIARDEDLGATVVVGRAPSA